MHEKYDCEEHVKHVIRDNCELRRFCSVTPEPDLFGDYCPLGTKSLYISYTCQSMYSLCTYHRIQKVVLRTGLRQSR